jgi:dTDP-4-dehydrorhamnose 3,5-epimerase-like enzyme
MAQRHLAPESDNMSALVRYIDFDVRGDEKGWLVALESERNIPFPIKRAYYIFDTQPGVRRGKHAHRTLRQAMICMAGSVKVLLDDGATQETVHLDRNDRALMLDPMVWHEMFDFSPGCVLLVLAETWYDEADYLRDYAQFQHAATLEKNNNKIK